MTIKPTAEYLRECFREEGGKLFWRERPREHFKLEWCFIDWNRRFPGKEAGTRALSKTRKDGSKYYVWLVCINDKSYCRYRVIWCMAHGCWAPMIDHEDMDSLNDRIENLRICTYAQNRSNSRKSSNNTTGFRGVTWVKSRKRWHSRIRINNTLVHLGYFRDPVEAHAAYAEAATRKFGEFART